MLFRSTGRTVPIVSPSKPVDEPIITTYTPEFSEDGTRKVDYENNPADKAWLEDFAKKICPNGGYIIGDIIVPADEDMPHHSVDGEISTSLKTNVSVDTIITSPTPRKTTANQKTPNYDSGKRLENWNKAQEKATAPKQEPVKAEPVKTETNAARWAKDDYYDSSNTGGYHSSGGYSSSSSSSSHSTSSSYEHKGHYDIGCTLFKNDDNYDINPDRYR